MISSQLLPGGQMGARRTENQDIAQERFLRRVRNNLHLVVCFKYTPLTFDTTPKNTPFSKFPAIITRSCCVDVYQAWPHEALECIADKILDAEDKLFDHVPWSITEREMKIATICSIMAQVHLSARSMAEKLYGFNGLKMYPPDMFLEFVDLFKTYCDRICKKEKEETSRFEKALNRMEEAQCSITKMEEEIKSLEPVLANAQQDVKRSQDSVVNCQKEYAIEKESCKQQELEIERLQIPIEILKKEADAEFDKVNPMFSAAWKAINSLNIYDVEEIRSYRTPPDLVTLVVNAICLLFNKEQTWEEGKLLLNRDKFFKDLEFYNVRGISDSLYRRLRTFIDNPKFHPEIVMEGSVAASSLCMWVRAVYDYCLVVRALEPKKRQLRLAEDQLQKAKSILGEMRVRCNAIKQDLEMKIQSYKDSIKQSRSVEKQIQAIESRKHRGTTLFDSMEEFSNFWQDSLKVSKRHLVTAPGDALVTAASVCYLGPVNPEGRAELLNDWLGVCDGSFRSGYKKCSSLASSLLCETEVKRWQQPKVQPDNIVVESGLRTYDSTTRSAVPVREEFSFEAILSTPEELDDLKHAGYPSDSQAVQNVLIMRASCGDRKHCWPLLLDPHNQAEMWVRVIEEANNASSTERSVSKVSLRSSSRRSLQSAVSRTSTALDYESLNDEPGHDETTMKPRAPSVSHTEVTSGNEHAQNDTELSDDDGFERDQGIFDEAEAYQTETPFTVKSEQTLGSNFESKTEKAMKEELAKTLGIQLESPVRPDTCCPTPDLGLKEGDISVISADDPQIVGKLRSATMEGLVVLVTNVERRPLSDSLNLLLSREVLIDDDGNLMVSIGKKQVRYNPSFRLYLSSSVPMSIVGEGVFPLPLSGASLINMSVSYEGVRNLLLANTLAVERPEYDGQERSLERDVSLHKQHVVHAKGYILEKTLNLNGPLLKDTTMLQSVKQSKLILAMAEQRLSESEIMHQQLLVKRSEYLPVAEHGALLFSVISGLFKLNTYYHFQLDTFLQLCHETIVHRCAGKKFSGSSAARAAELVDALTKHIYTRISWSLFLGDNDLFPFLIALEKMLAEGLVTVKECQLFMRMPSCSLTVQVQTKEMNIKPDWVSHQAWEELNRLQMLSPFSEVKNSILHKPKQWQEYFSLPPVLLSAAPCDSQLQTPLTVFQKALLWKTLCENQVHHIAHDLVLYQLGASVNQAISYDTEQVLQCTRNTTPVIFMLPTESMRRDGRVAKVIDAESEIISLAKRKGIRDHVDVLTLASKHQLCLALAAVERAMEQGRWVILTNCHLAPEWSQDFLEKLQYLVAVGESVIEDDMIEDTLASNTATSQLSKPQIKNEIHKDFRLWIITKTDVGRPLPAVLIQHGLKLACEAKGGFKETIKNTCEVVLSSIADKKGFSSVNTNTLTIQSPVPLPAIYSLALLHSLLHCRRKVSVQGFSYPYQWSQQDLKVASDGLCYLFKLCTHDVHMKSLQASPLQYMLCNVVYGGHIDDERDWETVSSLTHSAIYDQIIQQLIKRPQGESETVESYLDNLVEIPIDFLGLDQNAIDNKELKSSRCFTNDLQHIGGFCKTPVSMEGDVVVVVEKVTRLLTPLLEDLPTTVMNETASSLVTFLKNEIKYYRKVLRSITTDLSLLYEACKGVVPFSPTLFDVAVSLGNLRVPIKWNRLIQGVCDVPLIVWLEELKLQLRAMSQYALPTPLQPYCYSLAAFVHKQAFFSSLLLDHANLTVKPVHAMQFAVQVMDNTFVPSCAPEQGVYLSGLVLCNAFWDTCKHCVTLPSTGTRQLPLIWLKCLEMMATPSSKDEFDEDGIQTFSCPLVCYRDSEDKANISPIVSNLCLPTCFAKETLKQRNVYLTVKMT